MLTFTLKKQWFEKIKSGEKTVEYREVKPYWTKRLYRENCLPTRYTPYEYKKSGLPPFCILQLGYTKKQLEAWIVKVEIIDGKDTDLHINKPVYAIHLANVIEIIFKGEIMTREEVKEKTSLCYLLNPNNSEEEKNCVIEKVMATRATIVSKAALCNIILYLQKQNAKLKKQLENRNCSNCRRSKTGCPNDGSCHNFSLWQPFKNPELQKKEIK